MIRSWFITGASSGFGRILTEKLLARGDREAATGDVRERSVDDLGSSMATGSGTRSST